MLQSCNDLYLSDADRVPGLLSQAAAPAANGATRALEMGEVISVRLSDRPFRVACVTGLLWVTVDGDVEDHVLLPGEARTFRGHGTAVIQALRTATARVDCGE
jgi:hypothetical protein